MKKHDDWYADIKAAMEKYPYDVLIKVDGHQWIEIFQKIIRRENLLRLRSVMGEDGHVNVILDPVSDVGISRALHLSVARPNVVTDVISPWVREVSESSDRVTIVVYPQGDECYVVNVGS